MENQKDYHKRLHKNAEGLTSTFAFAKSMRNAPTVAEAILWECLRNRKLDGFKFRRQHPVSRFVADFYCAEKKLAVEVDGSIHREKSRLKLIKRRLQSLRSMTFGF